MKARQKRRVRRVSAVVEGIDTQTLNSIKHRLEALQTQAFPEADLSAISGQLDRIEHRMDSIEAAAVRQGAIAGGIAGGVAGGLITTTILLIKSRFGF